MMRLSLAVIALAASAACAPALTSGAYSPRPFPKAPGTVVPSARGRSAPETPRPAGTAGPSVAADRASLTGDRAAISGAVLATAMGLTGVPYRLGGSDPTGFDCSGFVQYVLRQHAIAMPRTVIEQFSVGETPAAIEPGDLVFFQTIGSQASHVGIAIDGQSFVHAPNSRGVVRVERLDAPYWAGRYLGARRVF
jgi:cell wall-associated NlpC family hydrolase